MSRISTPVVDVQPADRRPLAFEDQPLRARIVLKVVGVLAGELVVQERALLLVGPVDLARLFFVCRGVEIGQEHEIGVRALA